jgi:hypothetical protein
VTALDELPPRSPRHLTASPEVRAVEFARRARARRRTEPCVLPRLRARRRDGVAAHRVRRPGARRADRTVRRALRVARERVAAYASALRLREEQQRRAAARRSSARSPPRSPTR